MPLALSSARLLLNATNKTRTRLQAELWTICIFITWSFRQGLWKYVDGVNVTVMTLKSMLASQLFSVIVFFQDSSLIKIKIWSQNLGPRELFISLHSYKGILLFPAFLLKDTECKSLSRMGLFETLRTSLQAPLSMGFSRPEYWVEFSRPEYWVEFSRPEYWSGQPLPSPGIFLTQELKSPALQADSLPAVILNRFLSTEGCTNQLHLPREAPGPQWRPSAV